jgi:hypothetical protein
LPIVSILEEEKSPPPSVGLAVWSPVAMERFPCIRRLGYWIFCCYGNCHIPQELCEEFTEGNVERDLSMGMDNATIRKNKWKA